MIFMPWSVCPAILAVASLCVFNCPQKRSKLVALCAALVVLLCGAGSIASAQTAYFSGAQTTLGGGFSLPAGVAVDSSGNVYVADTNDNAVKEILAAGGYTTINTLASSFNKPNGVAVDSSGNVYVADTNDNAVKEILAAGGYTTVNTLGSGFNLPAGVAVDRSGNVYVADAGNNAVKEILAAGGYTRVNTLGSGFSKPNGVAVDGSGNVYVADAGNNAVKEILAAGGYTTINTLGSGFNDPSGVAVDGSGNVYVADAGDNAVKEILAAGGYTTVNTLGSGFNLPAGVAVDGHGNLFVADADNNRVEELALSGGNFGPVNIGTTSPAIPMVFTFDTGGTLGSTAVLMQGASGQDFADAGGNSCTAGTSYNAGEACTVNVTFTAQYAGTRYGAVVLRNSNGNPIATGYVQGTGVGPQVSFLPGAQLTVDSFVNPWGAAVDGNGNLYVADNGNLSNLPSGVYKETLSGGRYVKSAIGSGFLTANGVAVDGAGNVYVADQGLLGAGAAYEGPGGVYLETLQGDGSYVQTSIGSGWELPSYVAVDGSGNVYVTDDLGWDGHGIVIKLTLSNGAYTQTMLGGSYDMPFGVAVDGSGNVYFADYAGGAVYELALSNGSYKQSTVASGFNEPYGVAVDGIGDVYVTVNAQNYWGFTTGPSYVIKETLQPNGTYTQSTVFTGSDFLPDVAVDGSGSLYLDDATSNEVYKEDDAYPPSLSFASTAVGSTSSDSPKTVTIQNIGNQELVFTGISYPTDFPEGAGGENTCTSSTSLNAWQECDLPIDFTPQNAGLLSENVTLTDNALNVTGATHSIAVSGTGTPAPAVLTWATPAAITYGTALSATQLDATANVAGTFVYSPAAGTVLGAGSHTLSVTFTPTNSTDYTTAKATVTLTVNKATPTVTWPTPAAITYGTPLSATQLNATASVPGAFTYTPAAGTVLAAGTQTLSVTFTPSDTNDYNIPAATTVTLTVSQATPMIIWPTPAPIYYGNALGANQLDATAVWTVNGVSTPVLGTYNYSAAAGSFPPVGTDPLTVTFTPNDQTDYTNAAMATVYLTVLPAVAPVLLTPLPADGATLTGPVTFTWTAGNGPAAYQLNVGTIGPGAADIYTTDQTTALTSAVVNIPADGVTVWAWLEWTIAGVNYTTTYTYTETGQLIRATMQSPTPNTAISGDVTFNWAGGVGPAQYQLLVGTAGVGSDNLYYLPPTQATSSAPVTIPADDVTVYVRLYQKIDGAWQSTDYTYTESGNLVLAAITSPSPGSTLGSSATFQWPGGQGPAGYQLLVGTIGPGSDNLLYQGVTQATQATVNNIPADGVTVFVTLEQEVDGVWQSTAYTYTESGTSSPPALQTPTTGTLLSGPTTFIWSPGTGPTEYQLLVGTTGVGADDLYYSGIIMATSATTVNSIPANGVTVFVRLYYRLSGTWHSIDYTYTESGSPTPPALQTPLTGTPLSGPTTFTWSTGGGPTGYQLAVGTIGVGTDDLYYSGVTTATSSAAVTIPANGVTVFVRLYYRLNVTWYSIDYTYTEAGKTVPAVLSASPISGTTLTSSSVTFGWAGAAGPSEYQLAVGTTGVGSDNLYYSGVTTLTSETVTVPTNGAKLYVRLYQRINGAWQSNDYTYTEQ
jgi:hypothetical protein